MHNAFCILFRKFVFYLFILIIIEKKHQGEYSKLNRYSKLLNSFLYLFQYLQRHYKIGEKINSRNVFSQQLFAISALTSSREKKTDQLMLHHFPLFFH